MSKDNKKITVDELVKKYNTLNNDDLKQKLIKSIVTTEYLPYELKATICEKIVETSYYIKVKDINGNEHKKLHVNSITNYMLYCLSLIDYYTTISIDYNESLESFNKLNKTELLDVILNCIPEREIKEFRMILDMVESDLIQNEYETHAFISSQVERFGELAGLTLTPLLEQLINAVNNIDDKTIDKIMNGLKKVEKLNKFTGKR